MENPGVLGISLISGLYDAFGEIMPQVNARTQGKNFHSMVNESLMKTFES